MINTKESIYNLTKDNEDLLNFLIANGFENLKNESNLLAMGKLINLEQALMAKAIDEEIFLRKYNDYVSGKICKEESVSVNKNGINIMGVLPCPIRTPLLDILEKFGEKNRDLGDFNFDLRSANLGIEFLEERINNNFSDFPDLITGAGMELFYNNKKVMEYLSKGFFKSPEFKYNNEFDNAQVSLKDPNGNIQICGVVPAVFLVNERFLNGRKPPQSWEDLLQEEFENSLSIPLKDLDLFNAVLLTIYSKFGYEGIEKLARSYNSSLHPSQMVKKNINPSAVSIAPYFFATMVRDNSGINCVWPSDGAIVSPIFLLAKKEKLKELKPVLDYFNSEEVAKVFSANGKFPSTKADFDNGLKGKKFMWLGWNTLYNEDITNIYSKCVNIFNDVNEVSK